MPNKPFERLKKLHSLTISMCGRYAIATPLTDEFAERRKQRQQWVNIIIVRKMCARTIEELSAQYLVRLRRIERYRKLYEDSEIYSGEYDALIALLDEIREFRLENGEWMLRVADVLTDLNIHFDERQMKAAFSISDVNWRESEKSLKEHKVSQLMHVPLIGDEALGNQMFEAMMKTIGDADENTKRRIRLKRQALLGI